MRIACVQCDVAFGRPDVNAGRAVEQVRCLRKDGVDLAVFPEAFLTGYAVGSREEANEIALDTTSTPEPIGRVREACAQVGMHAVLGFVGREGDTLFNGAVLLCPDGATHWYRKTHLPELGFDKFASPGSALPVFETEIGRIGVLICFDQRHPEPARVLALGGAELIVLPTNWPDGAQVSAEFMSVARAAENRVFFATCNRVGEENGFRFIGRSKIIGPTGQVLAAAGDGEEVITGALDLSEARIKRTVTIPGKYETTVFDSRRPELYRTLVG